MRTGRDARVLVGMTNTRPASPPVCGPGSHGWRYCRSSTRGRGSRQWWTLSAPSRWVMGMSVTGPGMAASLDRGHSDLRSGDNEFVKAADPSVCLGKQHGLLGGPPRLTRARSGASGHGLLPSRDSQKVWNLRAGKTARPQLCPQAVVRTLRGMSEAGQGVERDLGDRAQRLLTGVGFPQGFDAAKDSQ
jgi:hypothetical protein